MELDAIVADLRTENARLRAENKRFRRALGDDLTVCSHEGCMAYYIPDGKAETTKGWMVSVGQYPPIEYCPRHSGKGG